MNSDTSVTAIAPTAEAAGNVYVTVTTIGGRSATGTNNRYAYTAVAPTVTGIDPGTGPSEGGTSVTVTGTNFTGASSVTFNGVPASFYVDTTRRSSRGRRPAREVWT